MKLETILNAHEEVLLLGFASIDEPEHLQIYLKRVRQAKAFRARILRMFELQELDKRLMREKIGTLEHTTLWQHKEIARLKEEYEVLYKFMPIALLENKND